MDAPFLSLIIPAFNEELRLGPTLDTVLGWKQAQTFTTEVIIVDDGSRDGTAALVERFRASHPDCGFRLVQNPGNRGKGYSVRHGVSEAKGQWVLFSDADLSAPIEEYAKLQEAATREQAAVAIGSRAVDRKLVGKHQAWSREIAGRVFNLFVQTLTGLRIEDTQCGFKLFSAAAAKEIFPRQTLDGFSFDVEILVIAREQGFKIVEVPVRWFNVEGSKVTLANGLKSFQDVLGIGARRVSGRYR